MEGVNPAMRAAAIVTPHAIMAARLSIGNVIDEREVPRSKPGDDVQSPPREEEAQRPSCDREQQAFDQHLPDQPETARAKRLPHRELTDTRRAAREQQVRNVRARHQQENRRRAQQQRQHVTQAASQVRAKRNDLCRDPGVGLRILAGELCRHNIELPLELIDRDARSKPADDVVERLRAQAGLEVRDSLLGHPDHRFRPPVAIVEEPQLESLRHDADDRVLVARVELQALTDDRRIAGEAAGPECVAQDHDPSAALSIFLGKERPAVQDRRPEHGEEVIADAGGVNIVGFAAREVEIEIEGLRHRGRFERADAREPVDGVSRSDVETTRARLRVVPARRSSRVRAAIRRAAA